MGADSTYGDASREAGRSEVHLLCFRTLDYRVADFAGIHSKAEDGSH